MVSIEVVGLVILVVLGLTAFQGYLDWTAVSRRARTSRGERMSTVSQIKGALIVVTVMVLISILSSCKKAEYQDYRTQECHIQGTGFKNELGDEGFRVKCPGKKAIYVPTIPGPKGDSGDKGDKGDTGETGAQGSTGAAGTNGVNGSNGVNGTNCSVVQTSLGATISCTDGTTAYIYNGTNGTNGSDGQDGQDGSDGSDGEDGQDGSSCSAIQMSNGVLVSCSNGTQGFVANGQDGQDGEDGEDGEDGQDGTNGTNGTNGQNGSDGVIEVINPCGVQGQFEELLFRLSDGKVYALYFGSGNAFLTWLSPGSYVTTDGKNCHFSVNSSNQVTW